MAIIPDRKDWTWVLERPCPECGFDAAEVRFDDIPGRVLEIASAWQPVLRRDDVTVRPDEQTWSPLEYGAHVRDVLGVFTTRLDLILDEDDPPFPNWDQDATAEAERYNEQDPGTVADELSDAAESAAEALGSVSADDLGRQGRRSDGAVFTVESLGRYFLHDLEHHLHDVAADGR